MAFLPQKKATLLIPSGGKQHLFVVLTDACPENQHLLVNFSSIPAQGAYDQSCLVDSGEHPFLTHPSYIAYRKAEFSSTKHLIKLTESGYYPEKQPISDELYQKICGGLLISPHISRQKKEYFRNNR